MEADVFALIKALTELPGAPGSEALVQDYLRRRWEPYCKDVHLTAVGNVVARAGGHGPRLVIEAHADEVGMVVKGISPEGFLWIAPRQITADTPGREVHLLGQPCVVQTSSALLDGVFATTVGHVAPHDPKGKADLGWSDVFVDLGVRSAAEVLERGVGIGDGVIWNPPTRRLGHRIVGKAMDDRAGLAVITRLLELISPPQLKYELYVASTVQEEMGLVGADSLAREERFDLGISIDVGLAGDIPGVDSREISTKLGAGPVLVSHDGRVHYDNRLTAALKHCARQSNLPVQAAVFPRYSSDGLALIRYGIPTALVAFATRYTHSPYEMVDEGDLEACVHLLLGFVTSDPG